MGSGTNFVYGPVPSRRLGRSLGVDLVPFKTCSYDCVYCQLGRTTNKTVERREWVPIGAVRDELDAILTTCDGLDFVTLSGSGEPTLSSSMGELIAWLKGRTRVPVAVLTNGSLLWKPEVRDALAEADLVVPSLDAASESSFRRVNRPHRSISLDLMIEGLTSFARSYRGRLRLEVLLVDGMTVVEREVAAIARLARQIGPERVDLGTVTRPPAEPFARPVPPETLRRLSRLFDPPAELTAESFAGTRDLADPASDERLLELLKRRPCTVRDLATSLRTPENDVIKMLSRLMRNGRVDHERRHAGLYYRATRES